MRARKTPGCSSRSRRAVLRWHAATPAAASGQSPVQLAESVKLRDPSNSGNCRCNLGGQGLMIILMPRSPYIQELWNNCRNSVLKIRSNFPENVGNYILSFQSVKHFNGSSANRRTRAACRTLGHGPRPAQRLAADFQAKMFAMSFRFCRGPKYQNIGCIDADFLSQVLFMEMRFRKSNRSW